jgi:hypothetical protein
MDIGRLLLIELQEKLSFLKVNAEDFGLGIMIMIITVIQCAVPDKPPREFE